jgi:hypothetical protein
LNGRHLSGDSPHWTISAIGSSVRPDRGFKCGARNQRSAMKKIKTSELRAMSDPAWTSVDHGNREEIVGFLGGYVTIHVTHQVRDKLNSTWRLLQFGTTTRREM